MIKCPQCASPFDADCDRKQVQYIDLDQPQGAKSVYIRVHCAACNHPYLIKFTGANAE